ncbi:Panacea domain-containing protein [Treponema pedis]|uniref:Panacea domain-containing protein n=1 Tax=Treponema pedis TaxID=409322 RepID=UPI0003F84529|nr:type II toxin-antitoxin system antitoxin SocA domain-containing protein [Treponema pedis]
MNAMTIAKYVINKCTLENCPVSNLQLQKILYYIQVAFLKELKYPCFDDPIEAWKFGPVVRSVYYEYSIFGGIPIERIYENIENCVSEKHKKIIDKVINQKKNLPPWALVSDTHEPGKAWSRTYNSQGSSAEIPMEDMRLYG